MEPKYISQFCLRGDGGGAHLRHLINLPLVGWIFLFFFNLKQWLGGPANGMSSLFVIDWQPAQGRSDWKWLQSDASLVATVRGVGGTQSSP